MDDLERGAWQSVLTQLSWLRKSLEIGVWLLLAIAAMLAVLIWRLW